MADVKAAVDAVLRQEDATLSGVITNKPDDSGGRTRFGLAERWHPELAGTEYYTTMPNADALSIAEETVTKQYAAPLKIAQIADQALATKVLSYDVNEDPQRAVEALQLAVNGLLPNAPLKVDGVMGPWTIAAVNRCMPGSLLNAFRIQMIARYARHAADNELRGLVNRALA